jgi:hypothetical protein
MNEDLHRGSRHHGILVDNPHHDETSTQALHNTNISTRHYRDPQPQRAASVLSNRYQQVRDYKDSYHERPRSPATNLLTPPRSRRGSVHDMYDPHESVEVSQSYDPRDYREHERSPIILTPTSSPEFIDKRKPIVRNDESSYDSGYDHVPRSTSYSEPRGGEKYHAITGVVNNIPDGNNHRRDDQEPDVAALPSMNDHDDDYHTRRGPENRNQFEEGYPSRRGSPALSQVTVQHTNRNTREDTGKSRSLAGGCVDDRTPKPAARVHDRDSLGSEYTTDSAESFKSEKRQHRRDDIEYPRERSPRAPSYRRDRSPPQSVASGRGTERRTITRGDGRIERSVRDTPDGSWRSESPRREERSHRAESEAPRDRSRSPPRKAERSYESRSQATRDRSGSPPRRERHRDRSRSRSRSRSSDHWSDRTRKNSRDTRSRHQVKSRNDLTIIVLLSKQSNSSFSNDSYKVPKLSPELMKDRTYHPSKLQEMQRKQMDDTRREELASLANSIADDLVGRRSSRDTSRRTLTILEL